MTNSHCNRRLAIWVTSMLLCVAATTQAADDDFSTHWHDGRAEIDGYRLTVSRYGESRHGQAVMIFVTEPMRRSTRVKADHPEQDPADVVDVLKLNLVRDFQTGIYDYNTMTSVFSRTSDMQALKVSFSSAEWCGHVYSESRVEDEAVDQVVFSYFEGESGRQRLDRPQDGWLEDELFVRLRGLRGPPLESGATLQRRVLPSQFVQRLTHRPPEWMGLRIQRGPDQTVVVPAGTFSCIRYDLDFEDGRHGEFAIEVAPPHRIVRWSLSPDLEGVLTGTLRTAYWQQNHEGNEVLLEKLGLHPVVGAETGARE